MGKKRGTCKMVNDEASDGKRPVVWLIEKEGVMEWMVDQVIEQAIVGNVVIQQARKQVTK